MSKRTLGIMFIIGGVLIYLANIGLFSGEIILIGLGIAFMVAYFTTGNKVGFLITGSVVTAVGIFAGLERWLPGKPQGYLFFLLLALAFANVYLLELINRSQGAWAGYVAVGLAVFSAFIFVVELKPGLAVSVSIWSYWPLLLIGVGLWLLLTNQKKGHK